MRRRFATGFATAIAQRGAIAHTAAPADLVACGHVSREAIARRAARLLVLASTATGCVTRIDMAGAYDAGRPATTIPYASVRGSRQFADYEAIGQSILTGAEPCPVAGTSSSKAAKPKGRSK